MTAYRHTQVGWVVIVPLLTVLAVLLGGSTPARGSAALVPWVATVLLAVLFLFPTLSVSVGSGRMECFFGVGLIRRSVLLSEVRNAEAVRNRWYYGWGIRLTRHGWLWNVSGLDAVEITFTDGRRFRVGTNDPKGLVDAIRGAQAAGNHRG